MSKKEVIYWGLSLRPEREEMSYLLGVEEPVPVITYLKKLRDDRGISSSTIGGDFLRCPAVIGSIKNTYAVLSPIDLTFEWDGTNITTKNYDQRFFDRFVVLRDSNVGFISLGIVNIIFFSESSITMKCIAANFNKTDFFKKTTLITGDFNIGNWFRPLDLAFIIDEPCTISIKKGDPLFYVNFDTEDNIVFKKFFYDDALQKISNSCVSMKMYFYKWPVISYFSNLYKVFRDSKIKGLILKHINNNLLG